MRICQNCQQAFDPHHRAAPSAKDGAIAQMRYCSMKCKRSANNRAHYVKHQAKIQDKARTRKRRLTRCRKQQKNTEWRS